MADLRPSIGCLGFAVLLQAALVLVPAAFLGGYARALADPVVAAFAGATGLFCAVELSRGVRPPALAAPGPLPMAGPRTDRLAGIAGTAILVTFWAALADHLGGFFGEPWGWTVRVPGLALLPAGIWLRRAAMRQLGELYGAEPRLREGQPLHRQGVYSAVRHPAELGQLLFVLGCCLWLGSLLGLALVAVLVIPAVLARVRRENAWLREAYGPVYADYARRVWNLLPGVY